MVLDVGAASTKTYIIEYGVVVLSHALSVGSQTLRVPSLSQIMFLLLGLKR